MFPEVRHKVVLFNANRDTAEMVSQMLRGSGFDSLIDCHFADVKNGLVDFGRFLQRHDPAVVIVDISPPYDENWQFFQTMRHHQAMTGRGLVVTTPNKERLDETVGRSSEAIEIVGKPYDLDQIKRAIETALRRNPTS
jgi:DNA-binding response OmpR family regulator